MKKLLGPLPGAKLLRRALAYDDEHNFFTPLAESEVSTSCQSVQEFITKRQSRDTDLLSKPIYIVPIGANNNSKSLDLIVNGMKCFLDLKDGNVEVLSVNGLLSSRLRLLKSMVVNNQKTYDAAQILEILSRSVDSNSLVIGVSFVPLATEKSAVSSFGSQDCNIAIVSLDTSTGSEFKSLQQILHHTLQKLSIEHCKTFKCLLNSNNSDRMSANDVLYLDPLCLRKLSIAHPGLQIDRRYENLANFANEMWVNESEESAWENSSNWFRERWTVLTGLPFPMTTTLPPTTNNNNSDTPITEPAASVIPPPTVVDSSKLSLLRKKIRRRHHPSSR